MIGLPPERQAEAIRFSLNLGKGMLGRSLDLTFPSSDCPPLCFKLSTCLPGLHKRPDRGGLEPAQSSRARRARSRPLPIKIDVFTSVVLAT
jgi:hypothetical protein